jgi:hypothetical protein
MARLTLTLVLVCALSAEAAFDTINGFGINAFAIDNLNGGFLDGTGILIGQGESARAGKHEYDPPENTVSNTIPAGVYFSTDAGMAGPNENLGPHATTMAEVMIGKHDQIAYAGVAPNAELHSMALIMGPDSDTLGLNRLATSRTARSAPSI